MKTTTAFPAICLISLAFFACKKEIRILYQQQPLDSARISITNISPSIHSLQILVNDQVFHMVDSPIVYGNTVSSSVIRNSGSNSADTVDVPYINIAPGYQKIAFFDAGSSSNFGYINSNFNAGTSYSLFLTDTSIHGSVTPVFLKDNFLQNDTSKSQIRFLNLSPDAPPLDVYAFPDAGYNGYKIFSQCAYIPGNYSSFIAGEKFIYIDRGVYYFEATLANTQIPVLGGYLIIDAQKVITIYTKGYFNSTDAKRIDVGVIQFQF